MDTARGFALSPLIAARGSPDACVVESAIRRICASPEPRTPRRYRCAWALGRLSSHKKCVSVY